MTNRLVRRAAAPLAAALTIAGIAVAAGSPAAVAAAVLAQERTSALNQPCFGGARRAHGRQRQGQHARDMRRRELHQEGSACPANTWANWNSGSTGNKVPGSSGTRRAPARRSVSGDTT